MAAEQADVRPRVLLANINPGTVRSHMVRGLVESIVTGRAVGVLLNEAGPYLDRERNIAAAGAMSQRDALHWDWLLFVDSDIEFSAAHIDTLLAPVAHVDFSAPATPVIAGLYYSGFPDPVPGSADIAEGQSVIDPVVYEWVERTFPEDLPDAPPRFAFRRLSRLHLHSLPGYDARWNPPPLHQHTGALCEVAAAGTGFMAIHHSILTTLAEHHPLPLPYFDEPVVNGVHLGEDMGLCHRVRALGYPVLVNRACVVLHHKTFSLA